MNEQGIMNLSDILALQSVKAAHCETVDECATNPNDAAGRFNELFTEDVRADYGMGALNGRNAGVEFLDEFRRTPRGWLISSVRFIQES